MKELEPLSVMGAAGSVRAYTEALRAFIQAIRGEEKLRPLPKLLRRTVNLSEP